MGVNAQLAVGNRMRAEALLVAMQIQDEEKWVKDEFLADIKGIGDNTKINLINAGIKTLSDLKKRTYKDINLSIVSVLALDRFLDKLEKEENEKQIKEKTAEAIEGKVKDEEMEIVEIEEDLFDKQ